MPLNKTDVVIARMALFAVRVAVLLVLAFAIFLMIVF